MAGVRVVRRSDPMNPVLNPTMYARVTGVALAATALLGIVMSLATANGQLVEGFLVFDWTHNILHVVLAGIALFVGFASGGAYARNYARLFGIVYLGLGIAGFFWHGFEASTATTAGTLGLELGENLVHIVIGLWGVAAGFLGSAATEQTGPRARST